ncbi:MAG: FliM/FliN family flagellar motor switch protein [Clostridium sp.]|nr:FliM/FliN family flagellar motor switch protein [Clostridium sp.]MCM1547139.1 FliM/FliN family flagellar motor switch protein [Ruminococcus sp.]
MSDVLSQSQIDELLKNLNNADEETLEVMSEDLSEKKVRDYDFRAPKKFTREQLKNIENIYENYSRIFSSYLTSITRFYCKVEVVSIEEQRFFEYSNALPDYTMMGNIDLMFNEQDDVMDAKCTIQVANTITFSLIDRMLGGHGKSLDVSRDFTDIEIRLMKNVFKKMAAFFEETFSPYMEVRTKLAEVETNARVNQPIYADDVIVLATLQAEYGDVKNIINIAVPAITMESIVNRNASPNMMRHMDSAKEKECRDGIIRRITSSDFKVEALLAETQLNLDEILSLHKNDVLLLNVPIDRNVSLMVNKEKLFDGKLGITNHRKAIKICNVYKSRRLR